MNFILMILVSIFIGGCASFPRESFRIYEELPIEEKWLYRKGLYCNMPEDVFLSRYGPDAPQVCEKWPKVIRQTDHTYYLGWNDQFCWRVRFENGQLQAFEEPQDLGIGFGWRPWTLLAYSIVWFQVKADDPKLLLESIEKALVAKGYARKDKDMAIRPEKDDWTAVFFYPEYVPGYFRIEILKLNKKSEELDVIVDPDTRRFFPGQRIHPGAYEYKGVFEEAVSDLREILSDRLTAEYLTPVPLN